MKRHCSTSKAAPGDCAAASGPCFGHPQPELEFWNKFVRRTLAAKSATPFYLFSAAPVRAALAELDAVLAGSGGFPPVRHWLSCKTQPLAPMLRWWRGQGRPIEVVSEFEFLAACREGFTPENILLNGPAKHHWLPRHARPELNVNFDSPRELDALLPLAKKLNWRTGIRVLTSAEFDPEDPRHPTQFGFEFSAAVRALQRLRRERTRLETVHFHLRTNVASPAIYGEALAEVAAVCRAARFNPQFLDCGGGLPPPHVWARDGQELAASFPLRDFAATLRRAAGQFPRLEEIWLENGRFVTARSGVLVVTVLDVKTRRGLRQLICDGGRTTHALVSNWEDHALLTVPTRRGQPVPTAVHGPTCMAFDRLARRKLPDTIRAGDRLVWLDAGAYHLPWETRFSHGTAAVFWHENGQIRLVRPAEDFNHWWRQWR